MPSIYQVFSRREALIAGLEVRGGSQPTGVEMLQRSWRVDHVEGRDWRPRAIFGRERAAR
jgi:hypothetical protein